MSFIEESLKLKDLLLAYKAAVNTNQEKYFHLEDGTSIPSKKVLLNKLIASALEAQNKDTIKAYTKQEIDQLFATKNEVLSLLSNYVKRKDVDFITTQGKLVTPPSITLLSGDGTIGTSVSLKASNSFSAFGEIYPNITYNWINPDNNSEVTGDTFTYNIQNSLNLVGSTKTIKCYATDELGNNSGITEYTFTIKSPLVNNIPTLVSYRVISDKVITDRIIRNSFDVLLDIIVKDLDNDNITITINPITSPSNINVLPNTVDGKYALSINYNGLEADPTFNNEIQLNVQLDDGNDVVNETITIPYETCHKYALKYSNNKGASNIYVGSFSINSNNYHVTSNGSYLTFINVVDKETGAFRYTQQINNFGALKSVLVKNKLHLFGKAFNGNVYLLILDLKDDNPILHFWSEIGLDGGEISNNLLTASEMIYNENTNRVFISIPSYGSANSINGIYSIYYNHSLPSVISVKKYGNFTVNRMISNRIGKFCTHNTRFNYLYLAYIDSSLSSDSLVIHKYPNLTSNTLSKTVRVSGININNISDIIASLEINPYTDELYLIYSSINSSSNGTHLLIFDRELSSCKHSTILPNFSSIASNGQSHHKIIDFLNEDQFIIVPFNSSYYSLYTYDRANNTLINENTNIVNFTASTDIYGIESAISLNDSGFNYFTNNAIRTEQYIITISNKNGFINNTFSFDSIVVGNNTQPNSVVTDVTLTNYSSSINITDITPLLNYDLLSISSSKNIEPTTNKSDYIATIG
jgi:hypothetical protein